MPLFQTIHSFITVLLLVIDEINYYLTRNNTYYLSLCDYGNYSKYP